MLKILLISVILVGIAVAGLAIRVLLEKNGQFSGGNCQSAGKGSGEEGISCGCGAGYCLYEGDGERPA